MAKHGPGNGTGDVVVDVRRVSSSDSLERTDSNGATTRVGRVQWQAKRCEGGTVHLIVQQGTEMADSEGVDELQKHSVDGIRVRETNPASCVPPEKLGTWNSKKH